MLQAIDGAVHGAVRSRRGVDVQVRPRKKKARANKTYTPISRNPSYQLVSPSDMIIRTIKAALAVANRSSGLPKTRFIGCPIAQDTSTSTGATTSAIWMAEPRHRLSTISILPARANDTATNRSDTVPISASTTTPIKTDDRPIRDAVSASRVETTSASNATPIVAPTITASPTGRLHLGAAHSSSRPHANMLRRLTST